MRKKIPESRQTSVLIQSRRRCCVCFGLSSDFSVKKGQIAHLDRRNDNADEENLVFLCFDHHDAYDSRTSQSKGLKLGEVRKFRDELYQQVKEKILLQQKESVDPDCQEAVADSSFAKPFSEEQTSRFVSDLLCFVTFEENETVSLEFVVLNESRYVGPIFFATHKHHSTFRISTKDERGIEEMVAQDARWSGIDTYAFGFRTLREPIIATRPLTVSIKKTRKTSGEISSPRIRLDGQWKSIPLVKKADYTKPR